MSAQRRSAWWRERELVCCCSGLEASVQLLDVADAQQLEVLHAAAPVDDVLLAAGEADLASSGGELRAAEDATHGEAAMPETLDGERSGGSDGCGHGEEAQQHEPVVVGGCG